MSDSDDDVARLRRIFLDPPSEARPRVWWHWMDGNVDLDGIRADLDWLQRIGVGGVQIFDGGMGLPPVVAEPMRPGSPAWAEALTDATTRARELGLEVAVATSSGWSASGDPWVRPRDAMKKVVWSTTVVAGGAPVAVPLTPLPATVGTYQDSGTDDANRRFFVDWRVLAVPADPARAPLHPSSVHLSSGEEVSASVLVDGSFAAALSLPRDPDGWSEAWVEQRFAAAVEVRSVVVGLPGPRGFGAAPPARAVLEARADDEHWLPVAELADLRAPARTASFEAVRAWAFRLVLSGGAAADALPPLGEGVATPPVLRPARSFAVTEFALFSAARVHAAEAKTGFGIARDYYDLDSPDTAAGAIDPADVIDLTGRVSDGVLRWSPPPGPWTVLRLGASLTGATNGPALPDATGLEVDKLDAARVAAYLDRHLERFAGDAAEGVRALLSDSIEAGLQNWTDDIGTEFLARRGYDPTPWLPALAGWIVGDSAASDAFLYDYRRTIADLLSDDYYGTLARSAHERGMVLYAEALEDGRPQLGDDLAMRAPADVPMGAMWTFAPEDGPRPTYVADLRGAASVAHVYGAEHTGSEAFTSFADPWAATPRSLKHVADLQLALGVTRFCIHSSPHQPSTVPAPGMALAPFLGQAFSRNETWAGMARPWIDYLARCSAVLAAGTPAVDIAVFIGEEAPVTGLFGDAADETVPHGFGFDYVGADALVRVLEVENGLIVARGAEYRVLFLGGSSHRMTVTALSALARLLDAGATVVGLPPESSPSLADDPAAFTSLRERIWGSDHDGRLVATSDLSDGLAALGVHPPVVVADTRLRLISRRVGGRIVTFVANPSGEPMATTIGWSTGAAAVARWDPVSTASSALPRVGPADPATFALTLAPFESAILVVGAIEPEPAPLLELGELDEAWTLTIPGYSPRSLRGRPSAWTDDPELAGFSGVGGYAARFSLESAAIAGRKTFLAFEDVRDIAEVIVNGVSAGVIWTAPYRSDVTALVRAGENTLEVRVANPWRNRLIAEASAPSGELYDPMTGVFTAAARPRPAGLRGRVTLAVAAIAEDQQDYSHT